MGISEAQASWKLPLSPGKVMGPPESPHRPWAHPLLALHPLAVMAGPPSPTLPLHPLGQKLLMGKGSFRALQSPLMGHLSVAVGCEMLGMGTFFRVLAVQSGFRERGAQTWQEAL